MTRQTDEKVLVNFYNKIHPHKGGWATIINRNNLTVKDNSSLTYSIVCMIMGSLLVYGSMFSIGHLLMGNWKGFIVSFILAVISLSLLIRYWKEIDVR